MLSRKFSVNCCPGLVFCLINIFVVRLEVTIFVPAYAPINPMSLYIVAMAKRMTCNKWACGSCQKQNHGNRSCDRCGTAKSSGLSLVVLPGDWRCGRCNTNNFASRKICYNSKCRQTRQSQSARYVTNVHLICLSSTSM